MKSSIYFLSATTMLGLFLLGGRLLLINYDWSGMAAAQRTGQVSYSLLFFVWNIFLAWTPYLFSLPFRRWANASDLSRETTSGQKTASNRQRFPWAAFGLTLLWLLFLPNGPYVITDLKHLHWRPPVPIWYDSILFFLFAGTGLLLGLLSMHHVERFWTPRIPRRWRQPMVVVLWLLCSMGIYLGREGRWNSWDALTRPQDVIAYVFELLSQPSTGLPAIVFCLVFTSLLLVSYEGLGQLVNPRN